MLPEDSLSGNTKAPAPSQAPDLRGRLSWKILPMFLLSGAVIWLFVEQLSSGQQLRDALRDADWTMIWLPLLLLATNIFFASMRWRAVLRAMELELSLGRALDAILSAWPFGLLTPSRAGELLRAVAIRDQVPTSLGTTSVITERLLDVQSLCLLAALGSAMAGLHQTLLIALGLLLAEWCGVLVAAFALEKLSLPGPLAKLEGKLKQVRLATGIMRASPGRVLVAAGWSMLCWLMALGIIYSLLRVFRVAPTPMQVLATWPVAVFVGMLPLTIAGVGTRDASFVYLQQLDPSTASFDEGALLAATLSYALIATWLPGLIGLPFMIRQIGQLGSRDPNESETEEPGAASTDEAIESGPEAPRER